MRKLQERKKEKGRLKLVCILAGNYHEAKTYARGQMWKDDEWFFPYDMDDLLQRKNFHVIIVGTAGQNVPSAYFDRIFNLAKSQGYKK